jgi:hypothetical protein
LIEVDGNRYLSLDIFMSDTHLQNLAGDNMREELQPVKLFIESFIVCNVVLR